MALIAKTTTNAQRSVLCDDTGRLIVTGISGSSTGGPITITPATTIITYGDADTIGGNAQTTLIDYTNTTGDVVLMDGFVTTGTVDAEYEFQISAATKMILRSSEQDRNVAFFLPIAMRIENSSSVQIKVTHYKSYNADFDATLFGHRW